MRDLIERQDALETIRGCQTYLFDAHDPDKKISLESAEYELEQLPSAQPDYQEVLGWLLAYHTMSFDLHGRYLPHEVISWLINDFTKEFIAERGQNG